MNNLDAIILLLPEITKGMKSVGSKALLKINKNTTVIDYQIQYIKKFYKNTHIFILTGFDHDRIEKKIRCYSDITLVYNPDYEISNQGQSLINYLKIYGEEIKNSLIINNGVLLKEKLNINHELSTIYTIHKPKDGFDVGINQPIKNNDNISYLFYDLPLQWSECVFLNKDAQNALIHLSNKYQYKNLFLFELINKLLENHININHMSINKKNILKINIVNDINRTKAFYDKNLFTKIKL